MLLHRLTLRKRQVNIVETTKFLRIYIVISVIVVTSAAVAVFVLE